VSSPLHSNAQSPLAFLPRLHSSLFIFLLALGFRVHTGGQTVETKANRTTAFELRLCNVVYHRIHQRYINACAACLDHIATYRTMEDHAESPYSIEIKTVKGCVFKTLIEALKEILGDTMIEINDQGVKIVAVDSSRVLLVHLKLVATNFEYFYCNGPKKIAVNMLNFYKIIKTINNNDTLTLFMKRNDNNQLGIRIENSEKRTQSVYSMNLLEMEDDKVEIPSYDVKNVVSLLSSDFQKICRDMDHIADYVEIKMVHKDLILSCKGDFCSQSTAISFDNKKMLHDEGAGTCNGTGTGSNSDDDDIIQGIYSLKYLTLFTRCTNLSDHVELYLKNDYPLVIKYSVATLGDIKLCLAPQTRAN
jgi:proliferating cell nuclear antigen